MLHDTTWAAACDAVRGAFWQYWEKALEKTAHLAGEERDLSRGLRAARREVRAELAQYSLSFVEQWVSHTHGGSKWLASHTLPMQRRRVMPPKEGIGVYRFSNGDDYHGEWRGGRRHGRGVYVSEKRGIRYDGEWRNDKRGGSGMLTIEEKGTKQPLYTYDGQWQEDMRHGYGSCLQKGREKYSGQWVANQYSGQGTMVDSCGVVYEGDWLNGKLNGMGKITYGITKGSRTYTGEFKNGLHHGFGQIVYEAAEQKEGEKDEGQAEQALGAEQLFAGQWQNGERHGSGKMIYACGEYEGGWQNGLRHGHGVLKQNKFQFEGPWKDDRPDVDGEEHLIFYPDGTKYTGGVRIRVKEGEEEMNACTDDIEGTSIAIDWWIQPHGEGMMKRPEGELYDGQYCNGLLHGSGLSIAKDRTKFKGRFVNGVRDGKGLITFTDGSSQEVMYEQGKAASSTPVKLSPAKSELSPAKSVHDAIASPSSFKAVKASPTRAGESSSSSTGETLPQAAESPLSQAGQATKATPSKTAEGSITATQAVEASTIQEAEAGREADNSAEASSVPTAKSAETKATEALPIEPAKVTDGASPGVEVTDLTSPDSIRLRGLTDITNEAETEQA